MKQRRCGLKYKTSKVTKEDWILFLLKRQKANMGMICAFVKTNERCAKQMIVNLRKKGNYISISGNGGFYELLEEGKDYFGKGRK
jgi:hypothetical protein